MPLWAPAWAITPQIFEFPVTPGKNGVGMPATATQSPVSLQISGTDLVAAAYLSGQPPHMLNAWGAKGGYAFRTWRIWAALGLLEPDNAGHVVRSAEYEEFDATEKSHLNYVLGGTLTKAYAASKLGVPWLAHLSVAVRHGYVVKFNNTRRPDYIGYANNGRDLVIAEAKGRQSLDTHLRLALDGKVQTGAVSHINRATPVKRYGVVAEARKSRPVSIYAVEPPEEMEVKFNAAQWAMSYYTFAQQLIEECADDPRPGEEPLWASMELRIPEAIEMWLERGSTLGNRSDTKKWAQYFDEWPKVEDQARAEADTYARLRQVTVLPDLLIGTYAG